MVLSIHSLRMNMARHRALWLCLVLLIVLGKIAPVMAMPVAQAMPAQDGWVAHCAMSIPEQGQALMSVSHSVSHLALSHAQAGQDFPPQSTHHGCCGDNAHLCDVHCAPLLTGAQADVLAAPWSARPLPAALIAPMLRAIEPPHRPPRA